MHKDPIDEELRFHYEAIVTERMAAGDTPEQAALYARQRLGNMAVVEDEVRDLSWFHRAELGIRHLRYAMRAFNARAACILAAGIALSVAVFSLVKAVVLDPLPFPEPKQIHMIWKSDTQVGTHVVGELAFPELADLRAASPAIEHVALIPAALYGNGRVLQSGSQDPVQIETCPATADFFQVLGVRPAMGRGFAPGDEAPGAPSVVVISDAVWRRHFGKRPGIVGEMIRLNGVGHTVIGVTGPAFAFPRGAEMWVPLRKDDRRGMTWLIALARLRPGAGQQDLHTAADRAFQIQVKDHLEHYSRTQQAVVTPLADYYTGKAKPHLLLAMATALLLLLSACASAGNLFLSRALVRRREMATRASLGASPGRILGQFVMEGLLAALAATAGGTLLALAVIQGMIHFAPAGMPRVANATVDPSALAFAALIAVLATAACAAGPALVVRGGSIDAMLKSGGPRTAGSRNGQRMQNVFVLCQSALTVVILASSLLLYLSYRSMLTTDIGFAHREALSMNLAIRGPKVTPAYRRAVYTTLLERLREQPQVIDAAGVLVRPYEGPIGWDTEYVFEYEAGTRDPHQLTKANFEVITPGYLSTVGTPLLGGRAFDDRDTEEAERVAIVSAAVADRIRATGRDPLAQRIRVFGAWRKIVGVTGNARYRSVVQALEDVYLPYRQVDVPTNYLIVHGRTSRGELLALVRDTLKQIDPAQTYASEATLGELIDRDTAGNRFSVAILILFAAGAILLAAAGIHSVVREAVTARAKELALKIALGATRGRLLAETAGGTLPWVAAGAGIGLAGAVAVGRAASALLYQVSPADPMILIAVAGVMLLIATLALAGPSWAAASQDPRTQLHMD